MYCTINHSSNRNSPHVAKCGPLRAGRVFSPHVRTDLPLDLQKFWSRLRDSPLSTLLPASKPKLREQPRIGDEGTLNTCNWKIKSRPW